MSDTPRTDEKVLIAWECFAPTKYVSADFARQLEREIARLQMELDSTCNAEELRQTRAENAALQDRAQRSELVANDRDFQLAERLRLERDNASLRHDLSVAKNWVEHHSKHADDLIAVTVALRAALDPERIIAAIELPGGHYCDPQGVADAIRAYCSAALVAHGTPNTGYEPRDCGENLKP